MGISLAAVEELPADDWIQHRALSLIEDWDGAPLAELLASIYNASLRIAAASGAKIETEDFRTADDYRRRFRFERMNESAAPLTADDLKRMAGL